MCKMRELGSQQEIETPCDGRWQRMTRTAADEEERTAFDNTPATTVNPVQK